jgi:cell division control protein 7
LVDLFIRQDKIHIILDYFKYKPFISFFSTFDLQDIKQYLFELLNSIKIMKNLGIYHRDIKPGNFLYNPKEKKGILIDFGLSELDQEFFQKFQRQEKDNTAASAKIELYKNIFKCSKIVGTNKIGTESFMPLESIMRYKTQSYAVDIWPVGVIFLQFALRKYNIFNNVRMMNKPQDVKNYYHITFIMELADIYGTEQVTKLCDKFGYRVQFPKDLPSAPKNLKEFITIQGFDDNANDLLNKLLCLDYEKRITVEDALNHPFFADLRSPPNNNNNFVNPPS